MCRVILYLHGFLGYLLIRKPLFREDGNKVRNSAIL